MSNVFTKILGKVWDVFSYPFKHAAQMAHILDVTAKDAPQVKDCIVALVEEGEKVGVDSLLAIGQKGLNLPEDIAVLEEAKNFFAYFKNTFCPQVEKIYSDLTGAKKNTSPVVSGPEPVGPELAPGPVSLEPPAKETQSGLAPA